METTFASGPVAVALCFFLAGCSPKINLGPYEVLGAITAEETAKLVENKGQVLVMVRDTGANKNPSVEAELDLFQRTLKRQPGLGLVIEKVPVTPMMMMATGGGVPPDQLFKALQTHKNLAAVVLFFGFPPLAEAETDTLKRTGVKIVVVSSLRPGYKRLLERQVIHLAIVPRPEVPASSAAEPRTVRERFDQDYLVITPAAASQLP